MPSPTQKSHARATTHAYLYIYTLPLASRKVCLCHISQKYTFPFPVEIKHKIVENVRLSSNVGRDAPESGEQVRTWPEAATENGGTKVGEERGSLNCQGFSQFLNL